MEDSLFGNLSGELRNRVYDFFFDKHLAEKVQIDIRRKDGAHVKTNKQKTRTALAFTACCRQIRKETLELFWSKISLRIIADNLTTYSNQSNTMGPPDSLRCSFFINKCRAKALRQWIKDSRILNFAHCLRPIDLDMGFWDPRMNDNLNQGVMLNLLKLESLYLNGALRPLLVAMKTTQAEEFKLMFNIVVLPGTALGIVTVPNDRDKALAVIHSHCDGRLSLYDEMWSRGSLTHFGWSSLLIDVLACRSAADLLVRQIM